MTFPVRNASDYIPQKPPFELVDELLYADEKISRCSFRIREDNFFVEQGLYTTPGLVESMAQTAAAGTGYLYKSREKEVPVGYIGSVQKLVVNSWPAVDEEIVLEIELLTQVLQVSFVSATVKCREKIIASCEMKIFINSKS